jgi:hypothetical protein
MSFLLKKSFTQINDSGRKKAKFQIIQGHRNHIHQVNGFSPNGKIFQIKEKVTRVKKPNHDVSPNSKKVDIRNLLSNSLKMEPIKKKKLEIKKKPLKKEPITKKPIAKKPVTKKPIKKQKNMKVGGGEDIEFKYVNGNRLILQLSKDSKNEVERIKLLHPDVSLEDKIYKFYLFLKAKNNSFNTSTLSELEKQSISELFTEKNENESEKIRQDERNRETKQKENEIESMQPPPMPPLLPSRPMPLLGSVKNRIKKTFQTVESPWEIRKRELGKW